LSFDELASKRAEATAARPATAAVR
jgi:hypothetical protein